MAFRPYHRAVPALLVAAAAAIALAGCAAPPASAGSPAPQAAAEADNFNDPFENTNRAIFSFNEDVDHAVLLPVAKAYRAALPEPIRDSLHDFLRNLNEPIIFANDALQGRFHDAGDTLARFAINSTFGIAGLVDLAGRAGLPYHSNDFGITMATWGVPDGPYLILPVLGPSNPRDTAGEIADGFGDPWNNIADAHNRLWAPIARGLVDGIDTRSRNIENLADLERTSLDFYATIRSLYSQRRAAQIRHEQQSLPNPNPVQGSDAAPYVAPPPWTQTTIAQVPQPAEVSTR